MPGERPRITYRAAASLDGFIADADNSLSWLFSVEPAAGQDDELARFMDTVTVLVEGSTTYEWVLAEENLLSEPHKWSGFYGERPTFVFTTRELPVPDGADVRFVSGPVIDALPAIAAAAGDGLVWLFGGGELVGQFDDAGALDAVEVTLAPVTLGSGAPLLPRRIDSSRLRLRSATADGQFVTACYDLRAG